MIASFLGRLGARGVSSAPPEEPRPEIYGGVILAVVFFVGVLGWAAFARLDAAAMAAGSVVVSGHPQAVQAPAAGIVQGLFVKEGAVVKKGQVLLEASSGEMRATVRSLSNRVVARKAEIARLEAERLGRYDIDPWPGIDDLDVEDRAEAYKALDAQRAQLRAQLGSSGTQRNVLASRSVQTDEQISGYQRQMTANRAQRLLIDSELADTRALYEKGYAPKSRVSALERTLAALDGEYGSQQAEIARLSSAKGEIRLTMSQYRSQRTEEAADLARTSEAEIQALEPQLQAAREALERSQIRSPVDGTVVGLAANTIGGVISAGQKLMSIVPIRAALVVEARVAPQDSDDLHIGQAAQVRVTAFHERSIPVLKGTITALSADSFTDERTGQPYFVVQVAVPRSELAVVERVRGSGLRPGLPVQVLVPLRKRTALQYWVEPLMQGFWKSFREH